MEDNVRKGSLSLSHTHTHTNTNIYIYIEIERERGRMRMVKRQTDSIHQEVSDNGIE